MAFLKHVSELLEESGEHVDAQALTPARTWVRYGGPDAAERDHLVHRAARARAAEPSRNSHLTERPP